MKNMTFHIKDQRVIEFLDSYESNKSEFVEEAIVDAIKVYKRNKLLIEIEMQEEVNKNLNLGSSEETVAYIRHLRMTR